MFSMKKLGLAFVAVLAVGGMSVASASATTFLAHPNSGTFPLLLLALAQGLQFFKTAAGTIECKHFKGHGVAESLESFHQLVTISYTGCKAFGLTATVSTVKYLFTAQGLASLANTVVVTATGCTVTVPSAKNQNLEKVLYLNVGGEILIHSDVTGITSAGTGASCTYAEENKGSYLGLAIVFADGGSVHWDA